jgi:hypothetical protein
MDPKDIEIGMTVVREMVRRGQSILNCEPFGRSFNVMNWTSAWRPLDFSSVVKGQEKVKEGSRRPKLLVLGEGRESTRGVGRCELSPIFDCRRELMGSQYTHTIPSSGTELLAWAGGSRLVDGA